MPDVLNLVLVLAAILVLLRLRVPLSLTLVAGGIGLGLLYRLTAAGWAAVLRGALGSFENLKLVIALEGVLLFSAVMKETGAMRAAIAALRGLLRDLRILLAALPALVGLLPVVGGAMLSAPLVDEASGGLTLRPERRTFLNYWFRHVWEYSLPTFPAVFLTASITRVPISEIVTAGLPLTLVAIAAGALAGFRGIRPEGGHPPPATAGVPRELLAVLSSLFPFVLVVGATAAFEIHLAWSIIAGIAVAALAGRLPGKSWPGLLRAHLSFDLAVLIWGIMLFKEALLASGAMPRIAEALSARGVPPLALSLLIPAAIAFLTGYTTAFVGLSFPLLVPFLPDGALRAWYVMFALAGGICAHMLSPMHACLAMTLQYYRASLGAAYRLLLLPAFAVLLAAAVQLALAEFFLG
ncbi:MAG: DUF401 family protein [Desulfobacterales bacterium]